MFKSIQNRKARHNYEIVYTYEAGLCLLGWEAKSIQDGRVDLKDAYVDIVRGEAFIRNFNIIPGDNVPAYQVKEAREIRKLLLKRHEIDYLGVLNNEMRLALPVIELKRVRGKFKIVIGVAKGKRKRDKRQELKERAIEMERRRGDDF